MSRPSDHPITYVYIHWRKEDGLEITTRYVASHDGAKQATDEAIRTIFGSNLPGTNFIIREIEVFENVLPRRFFYESVIKRDFNLKEQ